ncbi:MAG: hypothetical protein ACJA08_002624 [Cyclobacteriaceae bacterium]|jgi:hypothetical protein
MINGILFISFLASQLFQGWDTLSKIKIDYQFDEILNTEIEIPVFSQELMAFKSEVVSIEGYVIPLQSTEEQDYFVLSRFPYNSCFFCGNAGPETVAEVYCKKTTKLKEEHVRVTGKLRLNSQDPLHLFYIIEDAEVIVLD